MQLGGCEMVLGVQWLATLGDIVWNFKLLSMEFNLGGEQHKLRGISTTSVQLISESNMNKLLIQLPSSAFSLWVKENATI